MKPDVEPGEPLKRGIRRFALPLLFVPGGEQLFHVRAHQIGQQGLLVWEVVVKCSRLYAHFTGNLAHRNGSKPASSKQLERRLAHPLGGFNANTACRSSQVITH